MTGKTKITAADRLQNHFEKAILNRDYEPGSRLPSEREVQEGFGYGRGTVRTAYRSLQEKGLIDIRRGGGAYVQGVESSRVGETLSTLMRHQRISFKHLIEFREAIESRIVAYAVERATEAQISALREAVDKLEDFLDAHGGCTEFYQMELNIHVELAKISGNPLFEWLAKAFQQNAASYSETFSGFLEYTSKDYSQKGVEDWRQLLDAMEKREVFRATMIMNNHTYQFSMIIQGLSQSESSAKSESSKRQAKKG